MAADRFHTKCSQSLVRSISQREIVPRSKLGVDSLRGSWKSGDGNAEKKVWELIPRNSFRFSVGLETFRDRSFVSSGRGVIEAHRENVDYIHHAIAYYSVEVTVVALTGLLSIFTRDRNSGIIELGSSW